MPMKAKLQYSNANRAPFSVEMGIETKRRDKSHDFLEKSLPATVTIPPTVL